MLNWINDPLIFDKKTANELITQNKENLIFIDPKNKIPNFFSAFVKKEDFIKKDKIVQPLQKTVYVKLTNKIIKQIQNKFTNKNIKEITEDYTLKRSCNSQTINRWFINKIFPLVTLRGLYKNKLYKIINEIEYFTDFLNKSKFYFPKNLNGILNDKMLYLVGCSMGDGHIDKEGKRWVLVDGSSNIERLIFSKEFMLLLTNLLKLLINSYNIKEYKNKYALKVNNKLFCRFLNFFYGLPYGKKKESILKKPLILKFSYIDLEKYFWRGLFDTDGSVVKQGTINFCSSDENILGECGEYLRKINIFIKRGKNDVVVPMKYIKTFGCIGMSHPRKQKEFLKLLEKGLTYKSVMIKKKNKISNDLMHIYPLLRVDSGNYRIRIHKGNLIEQGIKEEQIQEIIFNLFGYKLKKTTKDLLYFKSKKVYEYLDDRFIFDTLWKPITPKEKENLIKEWNKVWN